MIRMSGKSEERQRPDHRGLGKSLRLSKTQALTVPLLNPESQILLKCIERVKRMCF